MWRRVFPSVVLVACLTASCSGPGDTSGSGSNHAITPTTDTSSPSSTSSWPPTVLDKTEHRAYPFTTVRLRRLEPTWVDTDGLPAGTPPKIPWIQPLTATRHRYRLGNAVIPFPHTVRPVGRFGDGYVAVGGCTRSKRRCVGTPGDGVHLVSQDGTLTSLHLVAVGQQLCCLTTSLDGRHLAWVVDSPAGHHPYRFTLGDSAPTELSDPAAATRRAFPRPVGFVGEDLILAVVRPGGREIGYVRTSGRPVEWDAKSLWVVAPRTLLGEPAFTKGRDDCLSRYLLGSPDPRWTRCYTWGGRPVGLHGSVASPEGRWLASMVSDDLVLVDLRTGLPKRRIQFDHRLQRVRFEDDGHLLVVLTREDLPGTDPWPVDRIVRCDLSLHCERATPDIEIASYEMLGFLGD